MAAAILIGIDLGTTFVKAVVLDAAGGAQRGRGRVRTPWRAVSTGAEIDPSALVDAALGAVHEALAEVDGEVAAVGVTGMAETGVLLDVAGAPVTAAIAWHDSRGEEQAGAMARALGAQTFAATTGLAPSALCTLAKYRWLADHDPEACARGVRWLGVPEYVVRCLGGDEVAERSLASRTGMLDIVAARWWASALDWAGVPDGLLAEPRAAGTPAGRVGDALERARGAILSVAGHDHMVAAIGAGVSDDDVLDDCGTAEALVRAVAPLQREAIGVAVSAGLSVGWHAVADRHALLSGFGLSTPLARVLRRIGVDTALERERVDRAAAALDPGEVGVRVEGLHERELSIVGPADASAAQVWRAALEATASMRAVRNARFDRLEWSPVVDVAARGAALVAGAGAGVTA